MNIFWNILFLILGLASLIVGANYFVNGASAVAKRLKVPSIIIGLTVVAIGTSLPELAVSISSAISGSADLSAANIVGSNLSNMLLILGIVAYITPVTIQKSTKRIDLPFMLALTALLLFFSADTYTGLGTINTIGLVEGLIFVFILIVYLVIQVRLAKAQNTYEQNVEINTQNVENNEKTLKTWQIILCLVGGLAAVVFGGECVSRTAKSLALAAGMSEALVGATIVAIGTSLPELVTSVVAAKKRETDLAVGNVIGSNIMNIALILGIVGTISPIAVSTLIVTDMLILLATSLLFACMCLTSSKLTQLEGLILIMIYIGYMTFAIMRNYM